MAGAKYCAFGAKFASSIFGNLKPDFHQEQSNATNFEKMSPKMSQNGVPRVASLFAKSGFFIDFLDFLKIDVEITQCQQALKPVLLLFDESPKIISRFLSRWLV